MNSIARRLLEGTADLIAAKPNRWTSHVTSRADGRTCALGTMIEYGKGLGLPEDEVRGLAWVLCPFLVSTNDNHGRLAAVSYLRSRAASLHHAGAPREPLNACRWIVLGVRRRQQRLW